MKIQEVLATKDKQALVRLLSVRSSLIHKAGKGSNYCIFRSNLLAIRLGMADARWNNGVAPKKYPPAGSPHPRLSKDSDFKCRQGSQAPRRRLPFAALMSFLSGN